MSVWLPVDEYIQRVSDHQNPLVTLSREEAVLLSLLDTTGPEGRCWACGADIQHKASQARYCDDCAKIRNGLAILEATRRYHEGVARRVRCIDCGREFPARPGPSRRCKPCQAEYTRQQNVERMRRRRQAAKLQAVST